MSAPPRQTPQQPRRARLYRVVFESDTPAGRTFDIALLWAILLSVLVVVVDSVPSVHARYARQFLGLEWFFTLLFSVEYVLRLASVRRPLRYARSFFGVVDLLAILPTYLSVLFPGAQSFLAVRVLRLLRIFRILKLGEFLSQAEILATALRASRPKITVFLAAVVGVVVIVGALMYLVEGPAHGYDSIPRSMYWAVVTLTTVGFGDITPKTSVGQLIASLLMVLGYGIIAVPTGIVGVELVEAGRRAARPARTCPGCGSGDHDADARFCKRCGSAL